MAVISSTGGMQSVTQAGLQQLKVQQAKQAAVRAEQAARSLRSAAESAQREADRAQENARSLFVRSDQADSTAEQARRGAAVMQSAGDMRMQLYGKAEQTVERQAAVPAEAPATETLAPVVNTAGQVTGTLVNTTA